MKTTTLAASIFCLVAGGCTGSISGLPPGSDGGDDLDAGVIDSGTDPADAGDDDAGQIDAGDVDAGPNDAGPIDAGIDSGVRDAGRDYDAGTMGDGDFTINPPYTTQTDLQNHNAPRGHAYTFVMDSTQSLIFDGGDPTLIPSKPRSLTRQIKVYVPAKYVDGDPAAMLVVQDGPGPFNELSYALDNLTNATDRARRIPPFIVISVQNGGNDAQGSERGLEYDTMSDRYARFIEHEVLPAVLAEPAIKAQYPNLRFTSDPEGRATYGCSSGAAAAYTMAWYRPDLFRRVISYSGTFVAQQDNGQPEAAVTPLGAWEYHSSLQLIANTPMKPIRAFLNVNQNDNGSNTSEAGHHNWVMANQRMTAALAAKGYHRRFVLANGLGHCAGEAWQSTLADALIWVWRGYPID